MIKLKNISKVYQNGIKALDNINLNFDNKELVFITGESGNGKSTLLNIIGCLDRASSGTLIINGTDIKFLDSKKISDLRNSYFGFVFQEFYLDDNLNVIDNIKLPLEKINKDSLDEMRLGEDLGISDLFNRKTHELSGGEKQRIQIMRALLKNSEVILADEPTGNLDENIKQDIYKIFKKISKSHLVVIVSHDLEAAQTYADRIINIKHGCIVSDVNVPKSLFKVNDIEMTSYELFDYINNRKENDFNLSVHKSIENVNHLSLQKVEINESKNISNSFVNRYNNCLIKNNKLNYIVNIIILAVLLPFMMWLVFFNTYNSNDSVNRYLNNDFYNYYVLYEEVSYTNDFYEDLSNNLYSGKKMYNELINNDLVVNPIVCEYLQVNDQSVLTNVMYDNILELDKIEVSDYYALMNNLMINDYVTINNKQYQISNIFDTEYEKYIDIIYSNDNNISNIRNNIIDYHINYIKINYSNLMTDSINIAFSNFVLTSFNKYSNTYSKISSDESIENTLALNEIIVSKSFASKYNISNDSIGKSFKFIDIRDDKYNNYYDNEISLNDYYQDGFIIKDIVDNFEADYYVSSEIFNQIVTDYDYYKRPKFYLVKNNDNLKNMKDYKFNEININNIYLKEEGFKETKMYLNIIFYTFLILIIIYNLMYINQVLLSQKKSIGLFKSFGFNNRDIKRIYNRYLITNNILILLFSSIVYNIIYLIYESIEKSKMLFNQTFLDSYSYIVYVVLLIYIIISLIIIYILYKKIDREEPINLMR